KEEKFQDGIQLHGTLMRDIIDQAGDTQDRKVELEKVREALTDTNWKIRKAAIKNLPDIAKSSSQHLIKKEIFPLVLQSLRDSHWQVLEIAVETFDELIIIASPGDRYELLTQAWQDDSEDVRCTAREALAELTKRVPFEEIKSLLADALQYNNDHWVQLTAIRALREICKQSHFDQIFSLLASVPPTNAEVYAAVTEVLKTFSAKELIDMYRRAKNDSHRKNVIAYLVPKLHEVILTTESVQGLPKKRVILYSSNGSKVSTWEEPEEAVQDFIQSISLFYDSPGDDSENDT
ncbi:MAG: HEAT repeat domain-containing protein, partial [Bacteroidota bacterium]